MFAKSNKNNWALFLLILAGIVIGGFIGNYLGKLPGWGWLAFGYSFGINPPFQLDLGIIALSIGLNIKFTIAGIIGIAIAIFIYRKL